MTRFYTKFASSFLFPFGIVNQPGFVFGIVKPAVGKLAITPVVSAQSTALRRGLDNAPVSNILHLGQSCFTGYDQTHA